MVSGTWVEFSHLYLFVIWWLILLTGSVWITKWLRRCDIPARDHPASALCCDFQRWHSIFSHCLEKLADWWIWEIIPKWHLNRKFSGLVKFDCISFNKKYSSISADFLAAVHGSSFVVVKSELTSKMTCEQWLDQNFQDHFVVILVPWMTAHEV